MLPVPEASVPAREITAINSQPGDYVSAEQNTPLLLHVVILNRKAVAGSLHLVLAHQQWGRISLLLPPLQHGLAIGQVFDGHPGEDAEYVEIGVLVVMVVCSRRTI